VQLDVEEHGVVTGDVAWGGNWFFLTNDHRQEITPSNVDRLTEFAGAVRRALVRESVTGAGSAEIDHIELSGPPLRSDADSKNFVLCPGGAYDRSPCGTGTSAKLACLFAEGKLGERQPWRQESIVGSVFEGYVECEGEALRPYITGRAFITAKAQLVLHADDPFQDGIPS
jgi:4-hydroxyproline epimerase